MTETAPTHGIERGVYFDGWFPRQHCYHPSLPPRRLRMVDDLRDYHSTVLVWSALGGGSISLPYLEEEAFGEIDPRFRFYGFVNDAEFIQECQKHGIKVMGIVFEVQGWEFPIELDEDESRILSLNERRGAGKPGWLGLREFSQNRYPNIWPPFEKYFPGGLRGADGEPVTDLLEEGCSRDIFGNPCRAHWVEVPDNGQYCYTMDRNNPAWREYLKAIIRIQIDAGVDGVQLDEAELPLTTLQYGGCFCRSCMDGFRTYIQGLPNEERPAALADTDLAAFHYGGWLLEGGYDFKSNREATPLFWDYLRFQRRQITRYFGELADYAREYAAGKGRSVLVSGNFFNLLDQYYALEPKVDLIITEMRNTRYRQPAWYRYVAGFAGPKPVVVVENPYGGVVPELVAELKVGRGYDLFRLSLYEAAALGANMSVPYGAWMGSIEQDAFWAPHGLCTEIQDFLAGNEALFGRETASEIAVIYSIGSHFERGANADALANNPQNRLSGESIPFWDVCRALADAAQPYDVRFFPDGDLRPDTMTLADLSQYRSVILPDCVALTDAQADLLLRYLGAGGAVLALGEFGLNLQRTTRNALGGHPRCTVQDLNATFRPDDVPDGPQIRWAQHTPPNIAVNVQRVASGIALHLVRYDYDPKTDRVPPLPGLAFELRLPVPHPNATAISPEGSMGVSVDVAGTTHRLSLRDVGLYGIVLLE